ncbi:MAG TPA: hypothetical protein DCM45_00505 [Clostridiales bacterium]|nr:hypothetical protein [Clostridiales bacterium]
MGRKKRNFETGEIYHIVQRGHNKSYIFKNSSDKAYFLAVIQAVKESLPFHLLYYVLMDNHFHLIVQMEVESISNIMRNITLTYSKYYNHKNGRMDTAYGPRFRAYHVENRSYLLNLILYLAFNPVRAGIANHPSEYIWCSHMDILTNNNDSFSYDRLLCLLNNNYERGLKYYHNLINQKIITLTRAQNDNEFLTERVNEKLQKLLIELMSNQNAEDVSKSRFDDRPDARTKREFIRLASEKSFKTGEIAKFLNVSQYFVRCCLADCVLVPGTKT